MYHRVRESKYRIEIVTFVWDFSEHLNPGDTILGTPVTAVIVSSGTDSNPGDMILGLALVTNGTVVSQRIRRGIPGTIYTITITATTVQGDIIEDEAYLAILPLTFTVPVFLQTALYPIEMVLESITSVISIFSGRLIPGMAPEGIQSVLTIASGVLFGHPLSYTMSVFSMVNGNEAIQSYITLISGTIIGSGTLFYTMTEENIKASITLISGALFGSPITYAMPEESIQSFINIFGGTLI